MLHIYYGDYEKDNYIYDPNLWFDNQADRKWLLEIGHKKDVLVRLGYLMDFGKGPFDITIENTGDVVHDMKSLIGRSS